MNLQNVLNGVTDKNSVFAVGASSNAYDYSVLLKFKIANAINYNLSSNPHLGYLRDRFQNDFVFIGKDSRVIGYLSQKATAEEMDGMLKRTMASFEGIYLSKESDRFLLNNTILKIDLNQYFRFEDSSDIEINLESSSNPNTAEAYILNRELVINRTNFPGYTRISVHAGKKGNTGYVEALFDVINPSSIYENFELASLSSSDVNFISSGDTPWEVSSDKFFMGKKSLKSGKIEPEQISVIETTLELAAPGTLVFAYCTSTSSSENVLNFYIDGVNISASDDPELWYGSNRWRVFSYNVRAGTRNLKWEYIRGTYTDINEDAVWIDLVVLPDKTVKRAVSEQSESTINLKSYPNPFNPVTQISFDLPDDGLAELMVFDVTGRLVNELHKGLLEKGPHSFSFDGSRLSSGIYYSVLRYGDKISTNKLVLTK